MQPRSNSPDRRHAFIQRNSKPKRILFRSTHNFSLKLRGVLARALRFARTVTGRTASFKALLYRRVETITLLPHILIDKITWPND
jgi:hypothetical protein